MVQEIILFIVSVILFFILIYIIFKIWFNGKRSRYLVTFFLMGVMCSFWLLFNGLNVLLSAEVYKQVYTISMMMTCLLSNVMMFYSLSFTNSRFANSKALTWTSVGLVTLDIIMLLTNPLHGLYIERFENLKPYGGSFAPVHFIICYVPVLICLVNLAVYTFKNIKTSPSVGLIFGVTFLPIISNILYTFDILTIGEIKFDITPIMFLAMFGVFAAYSIRLRLFNVAKAAEGTIFNTLNDALLVADSAGIIVEVNPAFENQFSGVAVRKEKTPAEEAFKGLSALAVEAEPQNLFGNILSNTGITDGEFSVCGKNGETVNYALYRKNITERGKDAGFIISLSDVSGYKKMIEEINLRNKELTELKDVAESASRSKSAFLANMSHEIRTPMNAIMGMTEIAKSSGSAQKTADCLDKIENASKHLLSILNDILDMSKIEANKYELNIEKFNCFAMIDNIVNMVSHRAGEKKQRLVTDIAADLPKEIISDQLRMSQVLNNLLSNAIKFTPENGTIKLGARVTQKNDADAVLEFSVEDNGIGISEETQKILFNAFTQADASISRKYGGTGLGLAISKNIVNLLGGDINLESREGEGSRFVFTVRAGLGGADEKGASPAPDENPVYDFTGKVFLLAEDVEINREIVMELMSESGGAVECAENGQVAYEMFVNNPEKYDLIFMDIHMPLMDGYTATTMIRSSGVPRAKTIPIIAMTANAFYEDIEKCVNIGMNDHIAKPVDFNTMYRKTASCLKAFPK